ncbi:MAG: copper amine oxidase N-terminal domain-containing protein [Oscillospiraceae bacterium]|nr:copper amine oxidase N-terminal domain-containing protein [Oscillospiraceae bacterium]
MKAKILSVILVFAFCAGIFVPVQVLAAEAILYTVGTTASGTRPGGGDTDVWHSVQIESDGLYKVSYRIAADEASAWNDTRIHIYDKTGSHQFVGSAADWFGGVMAKYGYPITLHNYNNFERAYVAEYAVYLHKGSYLLRVTKGGPVLNYSFIMEKIVSPYGEDKEPNDTANGAISLAVNGKAGGALGGAREDKSQDESDFYKIVIPSPMKCVFHLIADKAVISLQIFDSDSNQYPAPGWPKSTEFNALKDAYTLDYEVDFGKAGVYYAKIISGDWYGRATGRYTSYQLTAEGENGGGTPGGVTDEVFEVDIPGEANGRLSALVTEVGIKLDITPNTAQYGYRIYRSTDPNAEGISISDFPLTKGQFVDVNVEPETDYYYTIRKVIEEAGFDRVNIEITPEVLGEASKKISLNSGKIIGPPKPGSDDDYKKNYILMKVGEPNMLFNEETMEIDPGRGTVPIIENGRALMPIRAIIEGMGGTVGWDGATQTVSLLYGELSAIDFDVKMTIDSRELIANGESKTMDIAPKIISERTMLPMRFVGENVGAEIAWIGSTSEIIIVFFTLIPQNEMVIF